MFSLLAQLLVHNEERTSWETFSKLPFIIEASNVKEGNFSKSQKPPQSDSTFENKEWSYHDFLSLVYSLREEIGTKVQRVNSPTKQKPHVGLCLGPYATSFALLAALDSLRWEVTLLPETISSELLATLTQNLDLFHIFTPEKIAELVRAAQGSRPLNFDGYREIAETYLESPIGHGVTIPTSATSGKAKLRRQTWHTLSLPARETAYANTASPFPRYQVTKEPAPRWLPTYRPHLYAGLQVVLQVLATGSTLLLSGSLDSLSHQLMWGGLNSVTHLSATPSFFRQGLFLGLFEQGEWPLRQLTLGGEIVDQPLLDRLSEKFPQARKTHIYATTETGRLFAVNDGLAGFPTRYLTELPMKKEAQPKVKIKIDEDELFAKTDRLATQSDSSASLADAEGWYATGDLVEICGERVYFLGRKSETINIGGNKVQPARLEAIFRELDYISDIKIYPKKSSLVGNLLAAEVVLTEEATTNFGERNRVQNMLETFCQKNLASYERPRFWGFVSQIELTDAQKKKRANENDS